MLHLTGNAAADQLLANDPFALLAGMLLDQQFPMERAFAGPYVLAERLGSPERLDPAMIADLDGDSLLAAAKGPPAIHRFPGSMAERLRTLANIVLAEYDGDAARIWRDAPNGAAAIRNLSALPGFGEQKAKIFLALVGKQLDEGPTGWQRASSPYGRKGSTMSVADVTSPESLQQVRAYKKRQKAKARR